MLVCGADREAVLRRATCLHSGSLEEEKNKQTDDGRCGCFGRAFREGFRVPNPRSKGKKTHHAQKTRNDTICMSCLYVLCQRATYPRSARADARSCLE
jgi:hypothetical protein